MSALQHQTSIILQPDGELIRAIVDPATIQSSDEGIQFQLGMLAQKVLQEEQSLQFASDTEAPATKLCKSTLLVSATMHLFFHQPM